MLVQPEAWAIARASVTTVTLPHGHLTPPCLEGTCPNPIQDPAGKGSQWRKHPEAPRIKPGHPGRAPSHLPEKIQERGWDVKSVGLAFTHLGSTSVMALPTLHCLLPGGRDQTWHVRAVNQPLSTGEGMMQALWKSSVPLGFLAVTGRRWTGGRRQLFLAQRSGLPGVYSGRPTSSLGGDPGLSLSVG